MMFDRAFIENPYPHYQEWLERGRIFWSGHFFGGAWVIPHYKDNVELLRDADRLTTEKTKSMTARFPAEYRTELQSLDDYLADWLAFIDPPRHLRIRRLLQKSFANDVINSFRPRTQQIVNQLFDQALQRNTGQFDMVADIATQLPVAVVGAMLGVPKEDNLHFKLLMDQLAGFMGNPAAPLEIAQLAKRTLDELSNYFQNLVEMRRAKPEHDLISIMLTTEEEGSVLELNEVLAQCAFFLFAGYETTSNMLGNALYSLLRHPEQMQLLWSNPDLVGSMLEETCRWEAPFQYTFRLARRDFELYGQPVKKGQVLILMFGAANRDEEVFSEPHKFDITRKKNPHLTFGYGLHHCIGSSTARMEGDVTFRTMLNRFNDIKLAVDKPKWRDVFRFRGLEALPVKFELNNKILEVADAKVT